MGGIVARAVLAVALVGVAVAGALEGPPGEPEREGGRTGDPEEGAWRRALSQVLMVQVPGVAWYWAAIETNKGDWDYALNLPTTWDKLAGDAIRFDDNAPDINAAHAVAGSVYYQIGRGNGLDPGSSAVLAAVGSLIWETAVEFREVHSINDTLMSSVGGPSLGEGMHRLGMLLLAGTDTRAHRWLGSALALPASLRLGRDGRARLRERRHDRNGLPADTWYELQAGAGAVAAAGGGDDFAGAGGFVRATSELVVPEVWRHGGARGARYGGAPAHRLRLGVPAGGGVGDLLLEARTVWVARIGSQLRTPGGGAIRGRRSLFGFATGFRYADRGGDPPDSVGVVELGGLAWRHDRLGRRSRQRLSLDLSAEYAQVTSAAYPAWIAAGGDAGSARSILRKRQSYHGWGYGVELGYSVRWRRVGAELGLRWDEIRSLDRRDRFPDFSGDGLHPRDRVVEGRAELAWVTPWRPLEIALRVEGLRRRGELAGTEASRDRTLVALEGRYRWQADPPLPAASAGRPLPASAELGPWPDLGGGDPLRMASLPMSFDELAEAPPGRWHVGFSSVYFNLWDGSWHTGAIHREFGLEGQPLAPWELRELERRHPDDPIYRADVEGWVARFRVRRAIGSGVTVSVTLPWVTVGRPNWDRISRTFHESLGLHVGDRRIFAPGRTVLYVRGRDRSTAIEGWDDLEGSALGDAEVAVSGRGWGVAGGEGRWAVGVEAPTGERDGLWGSGGWDVGLRYAVAWSRGRSQWRAGAGFTRLDRAGRLLGVKRADTWHLAAGWRHAFRRGSQLMTELAFATSPLADFTDTAPGEPSLTVGLGGRFALGRDVALTLALVENVTSAGSAPDVVLGLRLDGTF